MKQEHTKQDNKFDNIVIVAFILIVALVILFAKDTL